MKLKKVKKKVSAAGYYASQMWSRICVEKCADVEKTIQLVEMNLVSCIVPRLSSARDLLEIVTKAASVPVTIDAVSEVLSHGASIRSRTIFDSLGRVLDGIARNHEGMYWWMSEKGLNMDIVAFVDVLPDPFDELASTLTIRHSKNGKISKESLFEIAAELDKSHFLLKNELQPREWGAIAYHNQKHSRAAVTTFSQAAKNKRFCRFVRKSLYRARDKKALIQSAVSSIRSVGLFA